MKCINQSIELDPSNTWAYKNRALVYIELGQNDKALNDLHRAKELGYEEDYDNEVNELIAKI
jgi:regulator of sirC expression with transglutaminase-like and TPR domain